MLGKRQLRAKDSGTRPKDVGRNRRPEPVGVRGFWAAERTVRTAAISSKIKQEKQFRQANWIDTPARIFLR
jgi:hypothetical protein